MNEENKVVEGEEGSVSKLETVNEKTTEKVDTKLGYTIAGDDKITEEIISDVSNAETSKEENTESTVSESESKSPEPTEVVAENNNEETPRESLEQAVSNTENEPETEYDASVLEKNTLEEIVEVATTVLVLTPKAASKKLNAIKEVFYAKYNVEKEEALKNFKESNTDSDATFVFDKASLQENIADLVEKVKQAKQEERDRIEQEKKKNLSRKEELLKKLEELVSQDETLESINQVKDIQREWKTIRVLPKDKIQELWDRFHLLLNKFYDNHSINIELKELDRQKNLEAKIELTKKVEALVQEKSLKRSFILLNKYHEEFKNIGPVPQESREPLWQAFKSATDAVYDAKKQIFEELEAEKEGNLKKKEILLEKAILVNAVAPRSAKDWNDKTKVMEDLFTEWKKIGPVPKSNKDAIWINFNGIRNDFYTGRKEFFKEINAARNENLKKKEALCEKVEQLTDNTDWKPTTQAIIQAQADWKQIGPVPEKVNQAIWKRFRAACDKFFDAKNQAFAGKREEEAANLAKKEELIKELQSLAEKDNNHKDAFAELKKINASWRATGFVPHKAVKKISAAYEEANNAVYNKYKGQIEKAKNANLSEHYKELKGSHNGDKALENEERNIKRKIGNLKDEISSIERNMSFFSKSKTADKMLKDFEAKIEKAEGLISKLKKELVAIKNARKEDKSKDDEAVAAASE